MLALASSMPASVARAQDVAEQPVDASETSLTTRMVEQLSALYADVVPQ